MNHKIILSYFLVIGFFICLVFAYMKYSNSSAETENDKLRQNIISTIDKEIANLQSQIDKINSASNAHPNLDTSVLNTAIENFIKSHPEIVASTLENFYKQKTLEAQHQSINQGVETIINDMKSGVLTTFAGKADAPIKVIEFFDYSCGYCGRMLETNSKLLEQNPDVNMVFIELPILGAESVEATRFATAVSMIDQSKYLQFQIQLLNSRLPKNRDNMMQIAGNSGIDVAKLQSFIENRSNMDRIEERIKQNSIIANNMHLQGTPTYIIDDEILVGAVSQDKINDAIVKAREKIKNINNTSSDKK
jgi:protein-disulfide isomerase